MLINRRGRIGFWSRDIQSPPVLDALRDGKVLNLERKLVILSVNVCSMEDFFKIVQGFVELVRNNLFRLEIFIFSTCYYCYY